MCMRQCPPLGRDAPAWIALVPSDSGRKELIYRKPRLSDNGSDSALRHVTWVIRHSGSTFGRGVAPYLVTTLRLPVEDETCPP